MDDTVSHTHERTTVANEQLESNYSRFLGFGGCAETQAGIDRGTRTADSSRIATSIPKATESCMAELNLREMKKFILWEHFKMEGIHLVKDLLQKGDWMVKLDLKDAYFAIPIHQDH